MCSIILRKLYPVVDWQSCLTLYKFPKTFFLLTDILFEKRPNLFISDSFICFVSLTGSIKYLCVSLGSKNIILCETFQDFSRFPEALLKGFHSDEPLKRVLNTLLIRHLVDGCANENSCSSSLVLVMYCAVYSIMSGLVQSILFTIVFPRYLAYSTHANFSHIASYFSVFFFSLKKATHFVLLLFRLSFVLNVRLCSLAYSSQVSSISSSPSSVGDIKKLSSANPTISTIASCFLFS